MDPNHTMLVAALLFLGAILASAAAGRIGAPLLLVFLALGMLAGEDGPGGIRFDDNRLAFLVGNFALAIILLDGGLRTRMDTFRVALRPALGLATVGVALTAGITGAFARWMLDLTWAQALLVGAIVGSTDAAAVFSLLHQRGVELKKRVAATLEIESGSNDPMAVFLTLVLVQWIADGREGLPGAELAVAFVQQMGLGAVAGLAGGRLLGLLVNRLQLAEGLYPLLVLSAGLSVFSVTNAAGGSGFLAIYLAGVVAGNRQMHGAPNILRVHDGLAWLAQIVMFLVLGLLVTPSELLGDAPAGLAIAAVLMLVARPLAVAVSLLPFRFPWRDQVFISWVGLRGAVPIILALFPLLAGLPRAALYFDVAFFVVLVSLVAQGWTIAFAARRLKLEVPPEPAPLQRVEVEGSRAEPLAFVSFRAAEDSPVLDADTPATVLGDGVRLAGWLRDGRFCAPVHGERLAAGDVALLLAREDRLDGLAQAFSGATGDARPRRDRFFGAFALDAGVVMADLEAVYGLPVAPGERDLPVGAFIARHVGARAVPGDAVRLGEVELVVRAVREGKIAEVGLRLPE